MGLHRLPDPIARAFAEANVYRLLLPKEFGGEELDPITSYDVVEEISSYDGSVGWNFSIGSSTPIILGDLSPVRLHSIFASPDSCVAASASAQGPCGRGRRPLPRHGSLRLGQRHPPNKMGRRHLLRL
jgi:indole-3-acetate monooxygenase